MTDADALADLDIGVGALLPPRYQHCSDAVRTKSMGSAGVRYGPDGRVLWDEIWTTFCDLALAGGPPHRGTLLAPVSADDVNADPGAAARVAAEIARALELVTFLPTDPAARPGWVAVACRSEVMAAWVVRAVVAENVSARRAGASVLVPAGPGFRVEKEVKNVVAAVAKAVHYWDEHTPAGAGAALAGHLDPVGPGDGWYGVECADEDHAVWLLRAVAVAHILVRREGSTLCLPTGRDEAEGRTVAAVLARAAALWHVHLTGQQGGSS